MARNILVVVLVSIFFIQPFTASAAVTINPDGSTNTQNTGSIPSGSISPTISTYSSTVLNSGQPTLGNTTSLQVPQNNTRSQGRTVDSQASAFSGDTSGNSGTTGSASGAVSDALGCSASSLLGQAIVMGLKSVISDALGTVVSSAVAVPISDQYAQNAKKSANAADANASVNAVQQINGVTIGASFNGIAFCIVNGLITYIADSTIAWANSGFQGNPVFLENPENFFRTIADQQASQFISAIGYNSTGINVCEPFRVDLAIALSESYDPTAAGGVPGTMSCSMDQIGQNFLEFANGGGYGGANIDGYWSNWNQLRRDENNPWGAYIEAGEYLRAQVSAKNNVAKFELGLNNGYLNFKKCSDKEAAKKGDTSSCKTYTPGSLIESSLNDTIRLGKERLVMADKIDQVVTALANALIKKALNTVLENNE